MIFQAAAVGSAKPKQEEHAHAALRGRDVARGVAPGAFSYGSVPLHKVPVDRLPYRASELFVTGGRRLADVVIGLEEKRRLCAMHGPKSARMH